MVLKSTKQFEEIIMYLSILRYIFKSRSKNGRTDVNKDAEKFFKEIFNITYGWNLENLNNTTKNFPAIDLGDTERKIAIQVTADNTLKKISETINKFKEHNLHEKYTELFIFIITDKKNYTKCPNIEDPFHFSKKNIKDIDDLLSYIESLAYTDKINQLHQFIKDEVPEIAATIAEPGSLLAKIEKKIGIPPSNCKKFFDYLKYDDSIPKDDLDELKNDIIDFSKRLINLSKNAKKYLCTILERGNFCEIGQYTYIAPKLLEDLYNSKQTATAYYAILHNAGLVDFDSHDDITNSKMIKLSFKTTLEFDLIRSLLGFATSLNSFEEIFVNCNFTLLDN